MLEPESRLTPPSMPSMLWTSFLLADCSLWEYGLSLMTSILRSFGIFREVFTKTEGVLVSEPSALLKTLKSTESEEINLIGALDFFCWVRS